MIVGLGVDSFDVDRIEAELRADGPAFLAQVFTPVEIAECRAPRRPAAQYAARFAAKEALLKALAPPRSGDLPLLWRDIAVCRGAGGRHDVRLDGRVRALAAQRGVARILLSIALTRDVAIASVVLESYP